MTKLGTKEKLIETAATLIWKSSYGSVSVDDICKAADVKKGSFYHFFKSKADLAIAAMEDYYENSKPIFDEIFSPAITPLERFEKLADMVYEKQKQTLEEYGHVCGCPFAALGCEMAGQDETIREKVDEIMRRYERYNENALRELVAEGLLAKDTDIKAKANKIYTFIMGQVMMARIQNSLEPLQRDLKTGLFRMIGAKKDITKMETI